MAGRCKSRADAVLDQPRLDDCRGRGRDHGRDRGRIDRADRVRHRLGPYVTYEAIQHLLGGEHPEVSVVGMILVGSSLIGMPLLGVAKQRLARRLGSQATHGEGTQNLLCAYLAAAVLAGLLGNAVLGAWWLDPVAALAIAAAALREGLETWRGEGCCAPGSIGDRAAAGCGDDCCAADV